MIDALCPSDEFGGSESKKLDILPRLLWIHYPISILIFKDLYFTVRVFLGSYLFLITIYLYVSRQ